MKTINDLNAYLPQIKSMMRVNAEIGEMFYGNCEDETEADWADNFICFEEDGWCVEVSYRCVGDVYDDSRWTGAKELVKGWGEVTDLQVSYWDEKTDTITEFPDKDLDEIWIELDKALENL